jgi:protein gp37
MNLKKIDWVIVGGESGRKPRPMKEDWVLEILDQCKAADVKFFFKQLGGTNKKKTGRYSWIKHGMKCPTKHLHF